MSNARKKTTPPTEPPVVDEGAVDDDLPKFSKEQLLKSSHYSHRRDVLTAVLEDGEYYTHAQVSDKLTEFLKKEVK